MSTRKSVTKLNARKSHGASKVSKSQDNSVLNASIAVMSLLAILAPLLAAVPQNPQWAYLIAAFAILASGMVLILRPVGTKSDFQVLLTSRPLSILTSIPMLAILLVVWTVVTMVINLLVIHPAGAYAGVMLVSSAEFIVCIAVFLAARKVYLFSRISALFLLLCLILGAVLMAIDACQEFALDVHAHTITRVYATSLPDYLSAYMGLCIPCTAALFIATPRQSIVKVLIGFACGLEIFALLAGGATFAPFAAMLGLITLFISARNTVPSLQKRLNWKQSVIALVLGLLTILAFIYPERPSLKVFAEVTKANVASVVSSLFVAVPMLSKVWFFGSGPGTYADRFIDYSSSQTQNAFVKIACEIGIVGLFLIVCIIANSLRKMSPVVNSQNQDQAASQIETPDEKMKPDWQLSQESWVIVNSGIRASIVSIVALNLLTSNLQVFSISLAFWLLLGLASGSVESNPTPLPNSDSAPNASLTLKLLGAVSMIAVSVFLFLCSAAAFSAARASVDSIDSQVDPAISDSEYQSAMSLAPWNAQYKGEHAYRVLLLRENKTQDAVTELQKAVLQEPSETMYYELERSLAASGNIADQSSALIAGITHNKMSLKLLLAYAKIASGDDAVETYKRVANLGNLGMTSANFSGSISNPEFAQADCAVADAAMQANDRVSAENYFRRAEVILVKYADEHGSNNDRRRMVSAGLTSPGDDRAYFALYDHVMSRLISLSPSDVNDLMVQKALYTSTYDINIGDALIASGDITDAKKVFNSAFAPILALPLGATPEENYIATNLSAYAQHKLEAIDQN